MAAIGLKRPARVALTRQQMILGFGHRPQTIQMLSLGVEANGHLTAVKHDAVANTSSFEDYQENVVNWGGSLYHCDNSAVSHKLAQLDLASPMDMRSWARRPLSPMPHFTQPASGCATFPSPSTRFSGFGRGWTARP